MATKTALRKLNAQIKADNEAFERLSPAKKRVAIARDVLAQIGSRLRVEQGTYVETEILGEAKREGKLNTELQKLFKKVDKCTVCAKGALFMCQIDRSNKLKLSEVKFSDYNSLEGVSVTNYLERMFDARQLTLIESAFEIRDMSNDEEEFNALKTYWSEIFETSDDIQTAIEFGQLFRNDADDEDSEVDADSLLRAIMENIVVNKGTFRPEIHPVRKWITAGFRG